MAAVLLDTLARVETPEGIALQWRVAGVMPRAAAWALDFLIRGAVLWALAIGLALLGSTGMGIYMLALFVVFWLYPVLFEALNDGQTPGKRALGLRVINRNGTPVTWLASFLRNLLRSVDMLPLLYGFGLVACLADADARRLGDRVAGTLVVYAEQAHGHEVAPQVPIVHAPVALTRLEQAAVVAFAERSRLLTADRQQELADILEPLTGVRGALAVQKLFGMASAMLGRH